MKIEICDLCKKNRPDKRFKVKMSNRGASVRFGSGWMRDHNLWSSYEKVCLCEQCAEKLLGVISNKTFIRNTLKYN